MALVADALVGEKARSAKEWLLHSSSCQQLLSVSSMKHSPGKVTGVVEEVNGSTYLCGKNSAREGCLDVDLHALDIPMVNGNRAREGNGIPLHTSTSPPLRKSKSSSNEKREGRIPSLTSTGSPLINSTNFKYSSDEKREYGIPPPTSTCAPVMTSKKAKSFSNEKTGGEVATLTSTGSSRKNSKSVKSPSNEKREVGIPALASTCSPMIKSKSSKSSSNQGSLQGLVVAPDGVTLVRDRRKCKPRGILTVGLEMSSFDSDDREQAVALPMPSPSVATVEWVDASWSDVLSPRQSHTNELQFSCSSVNSKSQIVPTFAIPLVSTNEHSMKEASSIIRGAVELQPQFVQSVQESYDVRESVEVRPGDLLFADSDVSCRPELAHELLISGMHCTVPTSSSKQQPHLPSSKVISPRKQTANSDFDDHLSETQSLDIRLSLDLEREVDVNGWLDLAVSERPCDYSAYMVPRDHSEAIFPILENGETHLSKVATESKGAEFLGSLSACPTPFEPCNYTSDVTAREQSETVFLTVEKEESPPGNPEEECKEIAIVSPSSVCPRSLVETLESENAGNADVRPDAFTDLVYAQDVHIVKHTHGEGSEIHLSELSQRLHQAENQLSSQVLVAETLYQLAAENLRKTRTVADRYNSPEEKSSRMEAVSSLSIVKLPVSRIDTFTSGEHTTRTGVMPLSSMVSPKISPTQDQARMDLAQSLKRIIISGESDLPQEVHTFKAGIRSLRGEAVDSEVQAPPDTICGINEEAHGTDQSSLALSRKAQRHCRHVNSSFCKPSLRRTQRSRFSSCGKQVGIGSFLVAAAAFGLVVVSLAMGSCYHCYTSNNHHHYIRPT